MSTPHAAGWPHRLGGFALSAIVLAALIAWVHGKAVTMGLFMDDHAHLAQLQACGWSLPELVAACRLELVGGVAELWWLPECTLRFFRPVAFALMKVAYTLVGWDPAWMHVVSLVWHLVVCVLLLALLRQCGIRGWIATVVAGLFAIHPAHVATVQWIACQTELMVTGLLLGAMLCYGRYRGWAPAADQGMTRGHVGWALASGLLFMLALGCRENAVMFPLVIGAAELALARGGRRPWALFGGLLVIVAGYLVVRWQMLGGAALPPRPYMVPPTAPDFWRYVTDKTWYYLLGEFLMIPCVPIGGLPYLQARPLVLYGLAAGVVAILALVLWQHRRRVAGLLGPAWLLGFMLPVLPAFESPHHLYLPGIGWAIVMALLVQTIDGETTGALRSRRTWRRAVAAVGVVLMGGVFVRAATWSGLALRTAQEVEQALVADLAAARTPLRDNDVLYVANMPLIGHYARLPLERRTGRTGLRVIPLTWSPRILGVVSPTALEWRDARTLELRVAEDRYFAGPLRRLIVESRGADLPDILDLRDTLGFRVEILERDPHGIVALRFTFKQPPAAHHVHVYWGSRARWAYEVWPPIEQ